MGYGPSEPERRSWQNSLRAMALVVSESGLKSHGVGIEYQLPGSSKRLDFMMQELNREANTLGSKAAVKALSDASMQMKLLIEQRREQVQNLE